MAGSNKLNEPAKLSKRESAYPEHYSLITVDRAEKLELLIHLISHLSSSIIVCGPKSIGKSTLLKAFQEHPSATWQSITLSGSPGLTLENLQQAIQGQTATQHQSKTVLIVDNAGLLAPGLVNAVIQHAAGKLDLRVVLALTPDELFIKNNSDSLVNECYVIDIPSLSEKQCGEFLNQLASKPGSHLAIQQFNDGLVSSIYHKTHGVPGNIIASLSAFTRIQKTDRTFTLLIGAVILLVSITLGIQWSKQLQDWYHKLTDRYQNTSEPRP